MTISAVQNVNALGGASVSTIAATLPSPTGSGNTLIATIACQYGLSVASIVDTAGNPWIRAAVASGTGASVGQSIGFPTTTSSSPVNLPIAGYGTSMAVLNPAVFSASGGSGFVGISGSVFAITYTGISGNSLLNVNCTVALTAPAYSPVGVSLPGTGNYCEIWYSRGVKSASTTASVTFSGPLTAGAVNIAEFNGIWYVDPLDQTGATFTNYNYSAGASVGATSASMSPRTNGELVVSVIANDQRAAAPAGYSSLPLSTYSGWNAAYSILSGSATVAPTWQLTTASSVQRWAIATATFVSGAVGLNPRLQFPETLVQISTQSDYLAPLKGYGVWRNISSYLRSATLGPLGRQHELDRVQASQGQFVFDNRTGVFNTWNTSSFLYSGGYGLEPMNPIRVVAAWNGVTYPKYYGYLTAVEPQIADVLNVDTRVNASDLFQIMSLRYLASNNYFQQIMGDNPVAVYRMGDPNNQIAVADSSGNGYTMSLIPNESGMPLFGDNGFLLYDANTSVDLTAGTKISNGGIYGVNRYGVSTPNNHSASIVTPLASASAGWSVELWYKYTGTSDMTSGTALFKDAVSTTSESSLVTPPSSDGFGFGNLVTGNSIPTRTLVVANEVPISQGIALSNAATSTSSSDMLTCLPGSYTLFSASTVGGQFSLRIGSAVDGKTNTVSGPGSPNVYWDRLSFGVYTASASGAVNGAGIWNHQYYLPYGATYSQTLLDGAWHHVVCTWTSASVVSLYVDGALDTAFTSPHFNAAYATGMNFATPAQISFGCDMNNPSLPSPSTPANALPGNLQDVALYNYALNASQVAQHYQVGTWFASSEVGASVGPASAGRLNKALEVIGLDPTVVLVCPYPFKTVLYPETNYTTTTSHLNYLQTMTQTEPGLIFQGPDGYVYAHNRQYQYLNPTTASAAYVYGDDQSSQYHYDGKSLQIAKDDLDVWNDIQAQSGRTANALTGQTAGALQEWGPAQSVTVSVSAIKYGNRTMQGLTALQQLYDSDALALAQNYAAWYNLPINRIQQIVQTSAMAGGANLVPMLNAKLIDRVTIRYTGQTPGPTFVQDSVIESIKDEIALDNGPMWTTTWAMSPYEILMNAIYLYDFQTPDATFTGASVTTGQLVL